MALKPGREEHVYDLQYFAATITGPNTTMMTRGGGLCQVSGTPGSGEAMDSSAQAIEYVANPSGKLCVGILLNDVVNIDFSRQQLNQYKDEVQVGGKVTVGRNGTWVTNNIMPGQATGTVPSTLYLGTSGNFTDVNPGGYPTVGQLLSRKDADGYAKVRINL